MSLCSSGLRSLNFDVGRPNHVAPFLDLIGKKFAELTGRKRKRCCPQIDKPHLDPGTGKPGFNLRVELANNFGRRVPQGAKAKPRACLVARQEFTRRADARIRLLATGRYLSIFSTTRLKFPNARPPFRVLPVALPLSVRLAYSA